MNSLNIIRIAKTSQRWWESEKRDTLGTDCPSFYKRKYVYVSFFFQRGIPIPFQKEETMETSLVDIRAPLTIRAASFWISSSLTSCGYSKQRLCILG